MLIAPLIIAQILLFGGLVLVLRYVLGRHAAQTTGHLQALGQEALAQQEALKRRLEETERQYQEQISKAQDEARDMKAQILRDAAAAQQQMLDQARKDAERIVSQAAQMKEALEADLRKSFEDQARDRACELLQQVFPKMLSEASHSQWVDELLKNGMLPTERIKPSEPVKEATVRSAFALTPSQRKQLQERLQAATGSPLSLKEVVDPALIAGLVIQLGHLVVDGSLASKLKEAARRAQDASG